MSQPEMRQPQQDTSPITDNCWLHAALHNGQAAGTHTNLVKAQGHSASVRCAVQQHRLGGSLRQAWKWSSGSQSWECLSEADVQEMHQKAWCGPHSESTFSFVTLS